MTKRGVSNGNERGSSESRRRRKEWLILTYRADVTGILVTYADKPMPHLATVKVGSSDFFIPEPGCFDEVWNNHISIQRVHEYVVAMTEVPLCRCYRCGEPLSIETVTVDRIIPGCQGGTYRRNNIRPACAGCNSETGGALAHAKIKKTAKIRRGHPRPLVEVLP